MANHVLISIGSIEHSPFRKEGEEDVEEFADQEGSDDADKCSVLHCSALLHGTS